MGGRSLRVSAFVVVATVVGLQPAAAVDGVAPGLLVALAVLMVLTGARTPVVWFKICIGLLLLEATLLVGAIVA